jgi:peptide-methionine (S)-S-oxide reductase
MNNNKFISIEGNIGSGKSTLLKALEEKYKGEKQIIFLKEPVDDWATIKDDKGITMLEKFDIFYKAEEYHQDYLKKNPKGYTCHRVREDWIF